MVLCERDRVALQALIPSSKVDVLHPPLRSEMMMRTKDGDGDGDDESPTVHERIYLTCSSRLSPEKNINAFIDIVEACGSALLRQFNIVPLLCGSSSDVEYARHMKQRLMELAPNAVIHDFLTTHQLMHVFSKTLLNVHPAIYEAYGMTIMYRHSHIHIHTHIHTHILTMILASAVKQQLSGHQV